MNRNLKQLLDFNLIEKIKFSESKYKNFTEQELAFEFIIEDVSFKSEFVIENMQMLVVKPKQLKDDNPLCLVLLHGLRDNAKGWIDKAKIRENYLTLKKQGISKDIIFIIPNSGYCGESWYSNFYNDKNCQYEDFFSKDLTNYIKKNYPNSKKGIAGFSMGGYGAFKIFSENLDLYDVVGSFAGSLSFTRLNKNLNFLKFLKFLWIPKIFFIKPDEKHFMKVFSQWVYKILKNNPLNFIQNISSENFLNKKIYLSVGEEDKKPYYMFKQFIDMAMQLKKNNISFHGVLYANEEHTWEYVSKDFYNFLIYFINETTLK